MNKKEPEIKFPCCWEYRVIAIASEAEKSRAALSLISEAEKIGNNQLITTIFASEQGVNIQNQVKKIYLFCKTP